MIWLGKSLRPVPTTAAPASRAKSGMISGVGLAMGRSTGSLAMERTMSWVTIPGADTPMNTSAPFIAAAIPPWVTSGLVSSASSLRTGSLSRPGRPG